MSIHLHSWPSTILFGQTYFVTKVTKIDYTNWNPFDLMKVTNFLIKNGGVISLDDVGNSTKLKKYYNTIKERI